MAYLVRNVQLARAIAAGRNPNDETFVATIANEIPVCSRMGCLRGIGSSIGTGRVYDA
jgi:hypothetical protein